ncbi:hypothetical protein [Nocardioides sp. Soil805]|uniref:hypothetical protein n=1 Tax=Nocardioides sp. Soil805 TaxID=1736416 RepID=UPI000702B953|nr:hypothetical protein [Nocardioides sp. Soil805]KRF37689.1 hypothetical protein ASG94_10460 [Nocardioides sp. Soil805]
MSTPMRVALFVTALTLVFGTAWGAGRAVEDRVGPVTTATDDHAGDTDAHDTDADAGHEVDTAGHVPGGLQVSDSGYTLVLPASGLEPGRSTLRFVVTGPDGEPVTAYDEEHEKDLHLIAVRRDLSGYQHVHPTMAADGTWTTDVDLTPGSWRVFADFTPTGGPTLTLGTDLDVAGRFTPAPHPGSRVSDTVDGYTVDLEGDLDAGAVTVRVSRDGEPVTDLEPYLGAYGHLVALREGDLAYLHVHPEAGDAGPDVPFAVEVPSAGGYRLFFDFKHDGVVRTAELAVRSHGTDTHADTDEEGMGDDH